jgi:tripartite-type tricarboxylate transporter receptor subunit TctC
VVASSPNLLVAYPGLKAKNLQEVVAEAKSGKLNYGTAGAGTTPHLTAEYLFKVLAKVDVTHIPFQGAGPALNATLGGQVEMASVALPAAVEMVKGGKVRGLAVTSNKRVAALPDVPTVAESGFPGFEDYTWVGVFAPSKTPPEVVQHLNSEINKILRSADFQAKLAGVGFEPVGGSTKEAADYLKTELAKWAKVVKETGTKVE